MDLQTILYFSSILLTCGLTGFLAWYAWRQPPLPGVRAYALLALSECLMAVTDVISMVSGTHAQALFWFNLRFLFTAAIPVIFLVFALGYGGQKSWFSKKLLAGALVIPAITQIMLWANSLHGLWVKHEVAFHQNGPFWIVETSARIPGPWFLVHSFYSQILMLAGIVLIFLTAWRMRRKYRGQALLLVAGALVGMTTSLIPSFNLFPQIKFNPFIPGIGISALLYALAIFRFQFLKHAPAEEGDMQMAGLHAQENRSLAIFILIFILFTTGIGAVGYLSYQNYARSFRLQVEEQLSAIAELKMNGLVTWRSERMGDANTFYQNPAFTALVQRYFGDPADTQAQTQLQTWLGKFQNNYDYGRIFLLDTRGVERISVPALSEPVSEFTAEQAKAALAEGRVTFLDLHRDTADDPIHLALMVPILADTPAGTPLGVLYIRIDPNAYLYPFIQSWPVPSQSAETLLIRREENGALFLNELRFDPGAALNLRFPLTDTTLPAVKAALGQTGIVEGSDYRNVQVVADVRHVPDSPWFLVSKMDTAEVYAPLRERLWLMVLFFGMLIAVAGAGLLLVWRQQGLRYYRAQVETMDALKASEEKFRLAFDTSPDSVAITRLADGMFVSVNKGFEQISGYTRQEALGKTSAEINIWKDPEDRRKVVEGLLANGEIRNYEAPFLTRNGEIYGLMSAVIIQLNGEPHILNITHDITLRKQAEEKLSQTLNRLNLATHAARLGVWDWDIQKNELVWDERMYALYGIRKEDFGGAYEAWMKGLHPDDRLMSDEVSNQALRGEREYDTEFRVVWPDGSVHTLKAEAQVIRGHDGTPMRMTGVNYDITERKLAEDELKASEKKHRLFYESLMDGFVSVNIAGKFLECNEIYKNMLGYTDAELAVLTYIDLTPEKWHAYEADIVENQIMKRGYSDIYEKEYRRKDGTIFPVELHTVLIRDEYDNPISMWAIARDITERKHAEETLRESERKLREAQEMAHLGFWFWDIKTGSVEWSEEVFKIFNLDPKEFTPQIDSILALSPWPEDHQRDQELINRAIETHSPGSYEQKFLRPDQSIGHYYSTFQGNYDGNGNLISIVGTVLDITERKLAEEKMSNSEMRYRRLFEAARDGILILDADTGAVVDVNPFMTDLLGFSREVFFEKKIWELGFFKDIAANKAKFRKLLEKEYIRYENLPLETAQGRRINVEFVSNVYQVDRHKVIQCNIRDITERKQAEDAQQQSELLIRTLYELSPDSIMLIDPHDPNTTWPIIDCNATACLMNGYLRDELVGHSIDIVNENPYIPTEKTAYLEKLREAGNLKYEVLHRHKNGTVFPVEISTTIIKVGERELVLGIDRDITERKQSEKKLAWEQYLLTAMLDTLPDHIYFKDRQSRFTRISKSLAETLGPGDPAKILGKTDFDFFTEEHARPAFEVEQNIIATGQPVIGLEEKETWPDGQVTWVDTIKMPLLDQAGNIIGTFGSSRNITERKQAEEQIANYTEHLEEIVSERTRELRQAQEKLVRQERLATLGQLAGSIGHELRNPLGVISNAIYFLKMAQPDASEKVKDYLNIIESETRSSDKIITDLLDFTRIKSVDREPADVSKLVRQTLERFPVPESVKLTLKLPAGLTPVYADPGQVVQVLGNLVTNAFQAMPEGGKLTLSAGVEGAMIAIAVRDTGTGISTENMGKLFEPLFTTKIKGIGLGLAVSQKLAEANGGRIEVQSNPGKGSTFTVYLPVYEEVPVPTQEK